MSVIKLVSAYTIRMILFNYLVSVDSHGLWMSWVIYDGPQNSPKRLSKNNSRETNTKIANLLFSCWIEPFCGLWPSLDLKPLWKPRNGPLLVDEKENCTILEFLVTNLKMSHFEGEKILDHFEVCITWTVSNTAFLGSICNGIIS